MRANKSATADSADRDSPAPDAESPVRLDKWLWAARFFKTRALAAEAVTGGKVHVGGQRAKPSRTVRLGEMVRIQRGPDEYLVLVKGLNNQRRPASEAVLLYEETADSRRRREELSEQRRQGLSGFSPPAGRPTKQDRRRIVRFIDRDE